MAIQLVRERELLFQAAASEHGLVLATANWQADVQALHQAKRIEQASLPPIVIMRSPWNPHGEIWIVKVKKAVKQPRVSKRSGAGAMGDLERPPDAVLPDEITLGDLGLDGDG